MENVAANPSAAVTAAIAAAGNGLQASGAGGERPEDASKQNLAQVTSSIQKTLGLLHQLNLTVSSFNSASQLPLLQRLNALVAEFDTMQKLAEGCNIQVPMEVVNLIDDGKNPDEFTRDVLNSCIAKNQITKGKTDAFKSLRKHLLEELEQAFPEDVEAYREIRATSAATVKGTMDNSSTILSFRNHFTVSLPNDFIRHNHFYQRITPPENQGVEALLNRRQSGWLSPIRVLCLMEMLK